MGGGCYNKVGKLRRVSTLLSRKYLGDIAYKI